MELGAGQISSGTPFCRINAAFHLATERRIHAAAKNSVVRPVEFFSAVSTERDAGWVGTFDAGLIYELAKNILLNTGVNIGVTRSADDWNGFVGLAWRF